jgi:hypothetical protein
LPIIVVEGEPSYFFDDPLTKARIFDNRKAFLSNFVFWKGCLLLSSPFPKSSLSLDHNGHLFIEFYL